jgi:hypothetical protein
MQLLLLAITAHLISDFVFQTDEIVNLKKGKAFKGFFVHSFVVFIFTFFFTLFYGFKMAFIFALVVSISHILLDFIKENLASKTAVLEFIFFIFDQILHFTIIYFIWKFFINYFSLSIFEQVIFIDLNYLFNFGISLKELLVFVNVYLIVLFAGAVFLEKILKIIDIQINNQSDGIKMGKYIGIIERALILTLVTFGSTSSIAVIFTAKSIARFKKFDDKKHFVEYYLLGTFCSIFIALIGGLLLKNLIL